MNAQRSHGRSPWRDAFELAMSRPTRTAGPQSITLGQSAAGKAYVKDMTVLQLDGEPDVEWIDRATLLLDRAISGLPLEAPERPQDGKTDVDKAAGAAAAIARSRGRRKAPVAS